MVIDGYADFACPWCFVGLRRFRRALVGFPGAERVRVAHRPFQLDAALTGPVVPLLAALAGRFGHQEAERAVRQVCAAGAEVGIGFRFDLALSVNTFDAHRLAWFAGGGQAAPDLVERLVERLFAAQFVDGRDVSDHGVLTELAVRAGLDGDRVAAYLASGEDVALVRDAVAEAGRAGVVELPAYVFPGGLRLSGSVSTSDYRRLLERAGVTAGSFPGHRR